MSLYKDMPCICQHCKSERIESTIVDYAGDRVPAEVSYDCADCKKNVDHWAHGAYQSDEVQQ